MRRRITDTTFGKNDGGIPVIWSDSIVPDQSVVFFQIYR